MDPLAGGKNGLYYLQRLIRAHLYSFQSREVRGGEVLGPMGRQFMGWRDWVGTVGGGVVVPGGREWGKTQYQKHVNSLPNGPEPHLSNVESGDL